MKRITKLGFKTLSTHIYFEKAENTLKLCFCMAVNQEAENNMDFKEQGLFQDFFQGVTE